MIPMVTVAINVVTVVMLAGIIWTGQQQIRNARKTTKMIEAYRHDIVWLTARMDVLEDKVRNGAK
jgi:hypothetical protein